jgi:ankyrin repeat protein
MPVKGLPPNASLDHLKYQAKDLLKEHAARDPQAAQRLREFHPNFDKSTDAQIHKAKLKLSDAQLAIARERGFASWARLKRHIEKPTLADNLDLKPHERIEDSTFRRAVDLLDTGDVNGLREHLEQHPKVVHQHVTFEGGNYFRNPTVLEFAAENPIRHGKLPANIVEVVKVILEAGAKTNKDAMNETLGLVCSGRVPRECRVQAPLIDLLCSYGADPNAGIGPALPHGEFEAVDALIRNGARVDLVVAATLGRPDDARRSLAASTADDRHRALALAAQFGHTEIIRLLLDAGEDPSRYNPMGIHSHSTPLHQAAIAGHFDAVRLLVERGARLDIRDVWFQGTPRGWAEHVGNKQVAQYFREHEK